MNELNFTKEDIDEFKEEIDELNFTKEEIDEALKELVAEGLIATYFDEERGETLYYYEEFNSELTH
jgi:DNA-binding MarR family transcriptional regulator